MALIEADAKHFVNFRHEVTEAARDYMTNDVLRAPTYGSSNTVIEEIGIIAKKLLDMLAGADINARGAMLEELDKLPLTAFGPDDLSEREDHTKECIEQLAIAANNAKKFHRKSGPNKQNVTSYVICISRTAKHFAGKNMTIYLSNDGQQSLKGSMSSYLLTLLETVIGDNYTKELSNDSIVKLARNQL